MIGKSKNSTFKRDSAEHFGKLIFSLRVEVSHIILLILTICLPLNNVLSITNVQYTISVRCTP